SVRSAMSCALRFLCGSRRTCEGRTEPGVLSEGSSPLRLQFCSELRRFFRRRQTSFVFCDHPGRYRPRNFSLQASTSSVRSREAHHHHSGLSDLRFDLSNVLVIQTQIHASLPNSCPLIAPGSLRGIGPAGPKQAGPNSSSKKKTSPTAG